MNAYIRAHIHACMYIFISICVFVYIRRLLGVSGSKANLHRLRGNHTQSLTILSSSVILPVRIAWPALQPRRNQRLSSLWGNRCAIFFLGGEGGGGVGRCSASRFTDQQPDKIQTSASLRLRNRSETTFACLKDAQHLSKTPPRSLLGDTCTPGNTSSIEALFRLRVSIAHSVVCIPSNEPVRY